MKRFKKNNNKKKKKKKNKQTADESLMRQRIMIVCIWTSGIL